jgi:hypothetical protein
MKRADFNGSLVSPVAGARSGCFFVQAKQWGAAVSPRHEHFLRRARVGSALSEER